MNNHTTKLLIVEDEMITALTTKMYFAKNGYAVCEIAVTGEEAVQMALAEKPDVILMDIGLAGQIDGIEAAREIMSKIKVFILFVTGYDLEDVKEKVKNLHPAGFFSKPLALNIIQEKIENVINQAE